MAETLLDQPRMMLQRWRPHQPLKHQHLNETVDYLNQALFGIKPPEQALAIEGMDVIRHQQFAVVKVATDYVVCNRSSSISSEGGEVKVALPYLLRRTPFDGLSRNSISYTYASAIQRTAGGSETQLITPGYVAGDIIYGISGVSGGTGVSDEGELPVDWLDLNLDGRAWAKEAS